MTPADVPTPDAIRPEWVAAVPPAGVDQGELFR